MVMTFRRVRFSRSVLLASCAALATLSAAALTAAWAADLPASPEGAQKLLSFFAVYFGKQAPVTVTPANPGYAVSFDLAALTAPLKTQGFSYDPALLKYRLVEQDDGGWRVEQTEIPPLTAHTKDGTSSIAFTGVKTVTVFDPAIAWWRSVTGAADKMSVEAHAPGVDETFEFDTMQMSGTGKASSDGLASAVLHQTFAGTKATIVAANKSDSDAKPTTINAHSDAAAVDIALDGFKSHALLDLWSFVVAHPTRPEMAANEAALKTLLAAALSSPIKVDETFSLNKLAIDTPQGPVTIETAKVGGGGAGGAVGAFEERFAADGLSLPATLVPAPFRDFAPTSVAFGFRASGFDVAGAAAEAIADIHLAGDGPEISADDQAKIRAKLIGPDGIVVDIPLSHILAPLLDLTFEGHVVYKASKPTGTLTVHMKNFDKTQAALKALGPDAAKQIGPMLAMAKGLAKNDPDGSLVWVGELGPDGIMKVNGLPLGKSPL
jgi:hypothetical protein